MIIIDAQTSQPLISATAKNLAATKDLEGAIWVLGEGLKFHPDNLFFLNQIAPLYLDWGNYEAAAACYRRSLALRPNDARTIGGLTNTLISTHRLDEAEKLADRLFRTDAPSEHAYTLRARIQFRQNDLVAARNTVLAGLDCFPGNVLMLDIKANIMAQLNRLPEALSAVNKGLELHPRDSHLNCTLAFVMEKNRDFDDAEKTLRAYQAIDPSCLHVVNRLGALYLRRKKYLTFERFMTTQSRRFLSRPSFRALSAKGLYMLGQKDLAGEIAADVIADRDISESAAVVYMATHDADESDPILRQIGDTYPEHELRILEARAACARIAPRALIPCGSLFLTFNYPQREERERLIPWLSPTRSAATHKRASAALARLAAEG